MAQTSEQITSLLPEKVMSKSQNVEGSKKKTISNFGKRKKKKGKRYGHT